MYKNSLQKKSGLVPSAKAIPAASVGHITRTNAATGVVARQTLKKPVTGGNTSDSGGVPQEIIDHLQLREGRIDDHQQVYMDTRDFLSAGMGHKLTSRELSQYKEGDTVPMTILQGWAQSDVKDAYAAANKQAGMAGVGNQSFINALTYVNFQLGTAWYTEHTKTWADIMAHKWEEAAVEAANSKWNSQTPVRVRDFQAALRSMNGTPVQPAVVSPQMFTMGAPIGAGRVTAQVLNVRQGPGTKFDKSGGPLNEGAVITIYGLVDGWYCIGSKRWVSAQFVAFAGKQSGPDLKAIAADVHNAMAGLGTDEQKVYTNLAKLNHDKALIDQFEKIYKSTYRTSVIDDIKSDFSNSWIFGNELDKALGYLSVTSGRAPKKAADAGKQIGTTKKQSGGPREKSGAVWVSRFPTITTTAGLKEPFKSKVDKFIAALKLAGASCTISATYRPRERAYLMHWSWMIVRRGADAKTIRPMEGVNIDWDHGTQSESVKAAREMTSLYKLNIKKNVPPSLTSYHIESRAIDMNIQWSGTLSIKDANGTTHTITSKPRNGTNEDLIAVGATYGVIHYLDVLSDPPHWSPDGH